jgi:hypothetical protein
LYREAHIAREYISLYIQDIIDEEEFRTVGDELKKILENLAKCDSHLKEEIWRRI